MVKHSLQGIFQSGDQPKSLSSLHCRHKVLCPSELLWKPMFHRILFKMRKLWPEGSDLPDHMRSQLPPESYIQGARLPCVPGPYCRSRFTHCTECWLCSSCCQCSPADLPHISTRDCPLPQWGVRTLQPPFPIGGNHALFQLVLFHCISICCCTCLWAEQGLSWGLFSKGDVRAFWLLWGWHTQDRCLTWFPSVGMLMLYVSMRLGAGNLLWEKYTMMVSMRKEGSYLDFITFSSFFKCPLILLIYIEIQLQNCFPSWSFINSWYFLNTSPVSSLSFLIV